MTNAPKIRGDRLVLGMLSVMRTLIVELDKSGAIQLGQFIATVDSTARTHRELGDPNQLADAIQALADHLRGSIAPEVSTRPQ